MIKLICDLNISKSGHNAGYVQYIVDHIKPKDDIQIYFLFNNSAKDIIDISTSALDRRNFYYCDIDFQEITVVEKFKFKEWKLIEQYARQLKIDKLFLMELTRYEVQIGKSRVSYTISGIEFRPSHRIKAANGKISTKLTANIQRYKRRFFETILLSSKAVEDIFILNDFKGVESLNKTYRTNVFKYLVDPIYDYKELDEAAKATLPVINKNKVNYIIFGSLGWRKNISNIFEAFSKMDKNINKDISLLIVGKITSHFAEEFNTLVQKFTNVNPDIKLIIVDSFVSDSEMEYYFSLSDISLLVYSKFYGSSGLLGRAAKYNMISLVPNVGLMAEICMDYKLGYLCDPNSSDDIKDKMRFAFDDIKNNRKINGSEFYESHSPQRFLELLDF